MNSNGVGMAIGLLPRYRHCLSSMIPATKPSQGCTTHRYPRCRIALHAGPAPLAWRTAQASDLGLASFNLRLVSLPWIKRMLIVSIEEAVQSNIDVTRVNGQETSWTSAIVNGASPTGEHDYLVLWSSSCARGKTTPNVPNQFLKSHHLDTYHKKLIPITG